MFLAWYHFWTEVLIVLTYSLLYYWHDYHPCSSMLFNRGTYLMGRPQLYFAVGLSTFSHLISFWWQWLTMLMFIFASFFLPILSLLHSHQWPFFTFLRDLCFLSRFAFLWLSPFLVHVRLSCFCCYHGVVIPNCFFLLFQKYIYSSPNIYCHLQLSDSFEVFLWAFFEFSIVLPFIFSHLSLAQFFFPLHSYFFKLSLSLPCAEKKSWTTCLSLLVKHVSRLRLVMQFWTSFQHGHDWWWCRMEF